MRIVTSRGITGVGMSDVMGGVSPEREYGIPDLLIVSLWLSVPEAYHDLAQPDSPVAT